MERVFKNVIFKKCDAEDEAKNACHKGTEIRAYPTVKFYQKGKEIKEDTFEGNNIFRLFRLLMKHDLKDLRMKREMQMKRDMKHDIKQDMKTDKTKK